MRVRMRAGPFSASTRITRPPQVDALTSPVGCLVLVAAVALAAVVGAVRAAAPFIREFWWLWGVMTVAMVVGIRSDMQGRKVLRQQRVEQERAAREAWLAGPPPPLSLPSRFTQQWLEEHVPSLHPGQVPVLLREMRARGWTEQRIADRVRPLLPGGS